MYLSRHRGFDRLALDLHRRFSRRRLLGLPMFVFARRTVAFPMLLLAAFAWYPRQLTAQVAVSLPLTPAAVKGGKAQIIGAYGPSQKLRVVFALEPPHMLEEEEFLRELQDRDSPLFHKYLSAAEWNDRFAPSAADEQAVVDWAMSQGLTITQRYPNRLLVDVEAPVAVIEQAFNVNIYRYQMGGASYFSNDRDPSIPAALANIVHSLLGLNSFEVAHAASEMPVMPGPDYSPGPVYALAGNTRGDGDRNKLDAAMMRLRDSKRAAPDNPYYIYNPQTIYSSAAYDYQALQNLGHCCNPLNNPGSSPPESSIAIVIWGDYSDSDITGFVQFTGYLAFYAQRYFIDGTPKCCSGETTLDVEWATAMANSFGSSAYTAKLHVYEGANNQFSTLLDALNNALSDGHARVLSMSWGAPEIDGASRQTMDSYHAVFNQLAGQGWTLIAASGDAGATTDCANVLVSFPASDPNVVAAGGTTLQTGYFGYSSEATWTGGPYGCSENDGGGGGGCSNYFAAPPYQTVPACGAGSRSVPDIALNADWVNSAQWIYFNGYPQGNGGTSIVAPELAGFVAQENAYLLYLQSVVGQTCGSNLSSPCAPIGNANYYFYDEGLNQRAPHYPFYDVTSGCNNNDVTQQYGLPYFCAIPGYDAATGWGSANMLQLAWTINSYLAGDGAGPFIALSGPLTNHWYNTDQTINWSIYDAAVNGHVPNGVAGYSYYWNSDPGDPYSEPVGYGSFYPVNSFYQGPQYPNTTMGFLFISSGGIGCNTAIVRAWDNAGQTTASSYGPVCFDDVPPYTYDTLLGEGQYPYYVGPVQVVLAATDYGSGVAVTTYRVDTGPWQTYTAPFNVVLPGQHTVYFYSTDYAGNVEQKESVVFTITSNSQFTLTVSTTGTGGGVVSSGDGDIYCGSVCSHLYYDGSQVTLTATPSSGSVVMGWTGCDSASGSVCTLTVDDSRNVSAIFDVPAPLQLVAVTPCRVADTRNPNGPFGGPPINGGDYRDFVIPESACGIPSTAAAYSLNIAVVPHEPLGYLTAWPSGLTRPMISNMNSLDGRTKSNAAIVPAGGNEAISVYVSNTADVILDINGYFAPPGASTLTFHPLTPCRVVDTRNPNGPLGGPYLKGQNAREFPVLQSNCGIPSSARAYSMNFAAVPHVPLGYLTAWPSDQQQPTVATLNAPTGTTTANAALVPAALDNGDISVFASNDTDLAIDINGYFAPQSTGGLSLYAVAPCRVLDTRNSSGTFNGELTVDVVDSTCAPPSQAQAYILGATVVPPGPLGYLTLWPDGQQQPGVATLNAVDGAVTSNMAVVPTNNGKIDAFASNPTQLIIDFSSYFAP